MNPDHMIHNSPHHHEHHGNEVEKDELWELSKENFIIKELEAGKSLQEIMDALPDLREAFERELDTIACSDERVPAIEGTKLGIAGQMILASKKEVDDFIERCRGQVKRVESHDGCGAAGKKFSELLKNKNNEWGKFKEEYGLEGESVKDVFENGDELGKWWSENVIAKDLNADYHHTAKEEMRGEIHDARAIYFDGTGRFNPGAIEKMPVGFTCSGAGFGLSPEYCKEELATLCGIAFGSHGFDDKRFSEENKFYILVCAKDQEQLEDLERIARMAVAKYNKKVEIKGFIHKVDEPKE